MKQIKLVLGGEERIFYFGLGFLGRLLEETETDMEEFDKARASNPFKWIPLMMFYSLEYGYYKKNETPDFDIFTVTDWIDEGSVDLLNKFNAAFQNSLQKDVPVLPESKKKVNKK